MKFKLGELFCGPGGLALGAGLARNITKNGDTFSISHIWGVDKDPAAIETYRHNVALRYGGVGFCVDAMEFCESEISNHERITALAFGFPCNDYSLVGKQKGMQGKYGNLYKAGIKAIDASNPFWFVAENVSGIHSADSGKSFTKILHELEHSGKYGYDLTVNLYKFELYGVPQYRHRYIIVGTRKDKKLKFEVPHPTHGLGLKKLVNVREAFKDIPPDALNSELTKQDPRVVQRLKFTPPWHNAWYLDKLIAMTTEDRWDVLKGLPWYKKEFKSLTDKDILKLIEDSRLKCKSARMSHIYKRLDAKQPAYTVTGSGGGGTHVYHWKEHRALTNRERAKLQSFPNNFEFKGKKEDVRKQIGMAVPPEGAKVIFEAILKTFAGIKYKPIDANYTIP